MIYREFYFKKGRSNKTISRGENIQPKEEEEEEEEEEQRAESVRVVFV
jgi:hypothetical protein